MYEIGEKRLMERRIYHVHECDSSSSSSSLSSSSSSDSEIEGHFYHQVEANKMLFGYTEPVHTVLGGGTSADIILWRNKEISGGILAGVIVVWLLFVWMDYHFLTFVCHSLFLLLTVSFLWSNTAPLFNMSPPKFPDVILPEELAQTIINEINNFFAIYLNVAAGNDPKNYLMISLALLVFSVISSWFTFLNFSFIVIVLACTVPAFYERYEADVDAAVTNAMAEIKNYFTAVDDILQMIPRGPAARR